MTGMPALSLVPRGQAAPVDLGAFVPQPKSRTFIVGATGTGKSTLAAALLDRYALDHPTHRIALIDSKHRFTTKWDERSPHLFPWGFRERNFGRRDQVPVQARILKGPPGFLAKDDLAFIVPGESADGFFQWLYRKADIRRPWQVFIDESVDFMAAVRAMFSLRRLIQQGRELGVGLTILHQRPAWVDQTFFSEARAIIAGSLYHPDDLARMRKLCPRESLRPQFQHALPARTWAYLDQQQPEGSRLFTFQLKTGEGAE